MAISVQNIPEPLTSAARESTTRQILIESAEFHQLVHELRRYCNGQITGRSFLIAGHRGSGKTTITLRAFEQIRQEGDAGNLTMLPLLVPLVGPSLLPAADESEQKQSAPRAEVISTQPLLINVASKSQTNGEGGQTPFENVLVQFTLGLHRALVNELAAAYRDRMRRRALSETDDESRRACVELAGQLALELDDYPGKARLREFWRRADALSNGVLPLRRKPDNRSDPSLPSALGGANNQGINELIALCSVSDAYRRISGKIQATATDKFSGKDSSMRKRDSSFKGKELFTPLIPLLSGAGVTAGLATTAPAQIPLAALVGLLTAVFSSVVVSRSMERARERMTSREELFLPDLSLSTLDRVLPVLLDRVRDAGLAPIFVIDELDKIDTSNRIREMVKRLKKLVAEKAFFCFLTDRGYFEELSSRNVVTPHSLESTYFTDQAFIAFRHRDFHDFIDELLVNRVTLGGVTLQPQADQEAIDRLLLPYILLHRAEMHPIDLRRQILNICAADDTVGLSSEDINSELNRLRIYVQIAIELQLDSKDMVEELARDPTFRRLAHDALYFVSREWQRGVDEVRIDKKGKEIFSAYMANRVGREDGAEPVGTNRGAPVAEPTKASEANGHSRTRKSVNKIKPNGNVSQSFLSAHEEGFLWKQVFQLIKLLSNDPKAIQEGAAKTGSHAGPVLDAVGSIGSAFLEQLSDHHVYRFRYDWAGRLRPSVTGVRGDPLRKASRERLDRNFIEQFHAAVIKVTDSSINFGILGAGTGVIATSPSWPVVELALKRLKGSIHDYAQKDEDLSNVHQFAELLRRSAATIRSALFCAWVLGSLESANKTPDLIGLQVISQALDLKLLPEHPGKARIERLAQKLFSELEVTTPRIELQMTGPSSLERWERELQNLKEQVRPNDIKALQRKPNIEEDAWNSWRDRLKSVELPVNFEAVICSAVRRGPSRLLDLPPEEMPARKWSSAFCESIAGSAREQIPRWLPSLVLNRLRFPIDAALATILNLGP
jgi:hypothetical protein